MNRRKTIANCKLQIANCKLIVVALLLMGGTVRADETKPRLDPGQAPDVQDVVFLGKTRPVLLRLHVLTDGKPYSQAWENFVQKVFKFADNNGDGILDENEVKHLPPPATMQQLVRGNFYSFYNQVAVQIGQFEKNAEGKVTLDEVKTFYRGKGQVAALQMAPAYNNYAQPGGNRLTSSLLRHLGGKDGKLDLSKLVKADDLVARLDTNDDETLDANELSVPDPLAQVQVMIPQPGMMMPAMQPGRLQMGESSFLLVPKETGAGRLTERLALSKELITRYDKDKSSKLTRDEIGLDIDSFKNLDRNGDGLLDAIELLRYFLVAPDVEMTVHLGKRDKADAPAIHLTPDRKNALDSLVRQASSDALMVSLTSVQMEVRSAVGGSNYAVQPGLQAQRYFDQIFRMTDKGNKGYIDLQEDLKAGNFQNMKGFFEMADRNSDGRVMKKEFDDMIALHAEAVGTTTTLTVSETSRGLFELLDTNRDGRLSVRELRAAAEKLKAFDLNGDGILSEEEIPVQVQMVIGSGSNPNAVVRTPFQPGFQPRPPSTLGPLWFRKMDRNGDGDVSRREFLGSPEDFKKLDLDGDGYISLEEAIKADALIRAKQTRKN